jgi:hypothetical protein
MKFLRLPLVWVGGLSVLLLAVDAFSSVEIPFIWAISPIWAPIAAGCGITGAVMGIVACIVVAIVGIVVGLVGLAAAVIAFVCGVVLALLAVIAVLAVVGAICAGALFVMQYMFGGWKICYGEHVKKLTMRAMDVVDAAKATQAAPATVEPASKPAVETPESEVTPEEG